MDKVEYQKYLASREWALLKKQIRERSEGKCERCMVGKYEATHHLTYERIGHENLEDLLGICGKCHEYLSGQSDYDPSKVTAEMANQAIAESMKSTPNLHLLHSILMDLDLDSLATDIIGLFSHIQSTLEEKFMPALCEHYEEWREARKEAEYYNNRISE